ncbi:MAG: ATP-binding cassette domain-containing protein, partial [Fibrobacterota bacterium]
FTFKPGKRVLITAESGRGKTTLLSILYGIRRDFSGTLFFDNRSSETFSQNDWSRMRRTGLSFLFQGLRLFDSLTAAENITLKNDMTNHRTQEEIEHYFDVLGIADIRHRRADHLSFGQCQRVALIRALCQPFEYLLLDEPFSHIDEKNIEKAWNLAREICSSSGAAMLLTSLGADYGLSFDSTVRI